MEVEEIQTQGHKFRRIGNGDGRIEPTKKGDDQHGDEEEDGEIKRRINTGRGGGGGGGLDFSSGGRVCGWPASRIFRVSRASGGKDRHSKVWTSKGLRDRRVRLSVNTAIQFYDLQDRLGYEQPSKAVEWLLKNAASSIAELPPISTSFPDTAKQLSDEKSLDSAQVEMEMDPNCLTQQQHQQQQGAPPKSACSSNSETSKGSGLSLSRSESRIKARERARERAKAAEKEKDTENESNLLFNHDQLSQNLNPSISQNAASFTELLTSGINGGGTNNVNLSNNHNNSTTSPNGSVGEANFFHKSPSHYSTPMDYFAPPGLLGPSSTRTSHGFSGQLHLGNPLQQALTTVSSPLFSFTGEQQQQHHHHHQELQHFSFVQDHFIPVVTTAAGNNGGCSNNNNNEYNLNFTIASSSSPGLAGFSRGTLQSKSSTPSLLPHIQRFASIDGSQPTFFIGAAAPHPNAAVPAVESHQNLIPGFDARLQLCYGDGGRHSDHQKGKGKG